MPHTRFVHVAADAPKPNALAELRRAEIHRVQLADLHHVARTRRLHRADDPVEVSPALACFQARDILAEEHPRLHAVDGRHEVGAAVALVLRCLAFAGE
jgi:hypothetical protein